MSFIADIEGAVTDAVKLVVTEVPVYSLTTGFTRAFAEAPLREVVLVGLLNISFGDNKTLNKIVQPMKLHFGVFVTCSNPRGLFERTAEVYDRIERIISALSGLRVQNATVTVQGVDIQQITDEVTAYVIHAVAGDHYTKIT